MYDFRRFQKNSFNYNVFSSITQFLETFMSKKDELNTKDVKINDNIDKYNDSIEKINKNETNTEEDMGNDIDNVITQFVVSRLR